MNRIIASTIRAGHERDGGGAVMAVRTHFDSEAGMQQVLAMGAEEGMRIVFSQIDAVLAGTPA